VLSGVVYYSNFCSRTHRLPTIHRLTLQTTTDDGDGRNTVARPLLRSAKNHFVRAYSNYTLIDNAFIHNKQLIDSIECRQTQLNVIQLIYFHNREREHYLSACITTINADIYLAITMNILG